MVFLKALGVKYPIDLRSNQLRLDVVEKTVMSRLLIHPMDGMKCLLSRFGLRMDAMKEPGTMKLKSSDLGRQAIVVWDGQQRELKFRPLLVSMNMGFLTGMWRAQSSTRLCGKSMEVLTLKVSNSMRSADLASVHWLNFCVPFAQVTLLDVSFT